MSRRRPRHGQNTGYARSVTWALLVSLVLVITGLMFIQTFDRTPDHIGPVSAVATAAILITWQVWRQRRRARLSTEERPPAEPGENTAAESPPEDTPPQ